jgi:hypothetical protein
VSIRFANLEPHEPADVRFGECGLCWLPADETHDERVAAERAEVEALVAASGRPKVRPKVRVEVPEHYHTFHYAGQHDHGGATYQPVLNVIPKTGFPVAAFQERNSNMPAGEFSKDVYNVYEREHRAFIAQDGARYIGTWLDKGTGRVHLDIVHVLTDEAEARRVAIANGEIAYFSFETMSEVRVDDS